MSNWFRNPLTKATLRKVNSFYFKQEVPKSNSPVKNFELKGTKARLDCTFKITEVTFFPVIIIQFVMLKTVPPKMFLNYEWYHLDIKLNLIKFHIKWQVNDPSRSFLSLNMVIQSLTFAWNCEFWVLVEWFQCETYEIWNMQCSAEWFEVKSFSHYLSF